MGKVKTVVIGDIEAEEKARQKAEVKREQKKLSKGRGISKEIEPDKSVANPVKSDSEKAQDILKLMAEEEKKEVPPEEPKQKQILTRDKLPKESKESAKSAKPDKSKAKHGKKYLEAKNRVDKTKQYSLAEALDLVKKTSYSKFDGTVEAHFNVISKGLRGIIQLPHSLGKKVTVAIADDKLLEDVAAGKINFDVLVASPAMMPKLAKVAKILGPKGLMPNPKAGTIGENTDELVKKLSAGQTNWKTEPEFPIIHTVLGKVSFDNKKLEENYTAIAKSIGKDKIKSVFLKATMGPSVKLST